jgi:hypothetical protein
MRAHRAPGEVPAIRRPFRPCFFQVRKLSPLGNNEHLTERATHAHPLHPAALAFVSYGIVLVRVRVPEDPINLRGRAVRCSYVPGMAAQAAHAQCARRSFPCHLRTTITYQATWHQRAGCTWGERHVRCGPNSRNRTDSAPDVRSEWGICLVFAAVFAFTGGVCGAGGGDSMRVAPRWLAEFARCKAVMPTSDVHYYQAAIIF